MFLLAFLIDYFFDFFVFLCRTEKTFKFDYIGTKRSLVKLCYTFKFQVLYSIFGSTFTE